MTKYDPFGPQSQTQVSPRPQAQQPWHPGLPQRPVAQGFAPQHSGQGGVFQAPFQAPAQAPHYQAPIHQNRGIPEEPDAELDGDEALEVKLMWGDTVLDHAHFHAAKKITVGSSRKNTFVLSNDALPHESFSLVSLEDDRLMIQVTEQMQGFLYIKGQRHPLDALKQSEKAEPTAFGFKFPLPMRAVVKLQLAEITFSISTVSMPEKAGAGLTFTPDSHLGRALGTSFILHGLVILFMLFSDETPKTFEDGFLKADDRFSSLIVRPQDAKKEKQRKERSGGARAKNREGKMGPKSAPKRDRRSGTVEKNKLGTSPINITKTSKKAMEELMRKGLLGMIKGGLQQRGGMIDVKAFGGDDLNAVGNWHGSKVGRAQGGAGLGLHGKGGNGGGGLDGNSVGIGPPGTIGRGIGPGGKNWAGRKKKLGPKRDHALKITFGKPVAEGGLDRKIIRRYINMQHRKLKYCYERELIKNPQLQGKIIIGFQIEGNGRVSTATVAKSTMNNDRVERCVARRIRYIRFPAPKGGGIVVVRYPFLFQPSGR